MKYKTNMLVIKNYIKQQNFSDNEKNPVKNKAYIKTNKWLKIRNKKKKKCC